MIIVEINKIYTRKAKEKVNRSRNQFFERINKFDENVARLRKKRKRAQINKIRNKRDDITNDTTGIQGHMRLQKYRIIM